MGIFLLSFLADYTHKIHADQIIHIQCHTQYMEVIFFNQVLENI